MGGYCVFDHLKISPGPLKDCIMNLPWRNDKVSCYLLQDDSVVILQGWWKVEHSVPKSDIMIVTMREAIQVHVQMFPSCGEGLWEWQWQRCRIHTFYTFNSSKKVSGAKLFNSIFIRWIDVKSFDIKKSNKWKKNRPRQKYNFEGEKIKTIRPKVFFGSFWIYFCFYLQSNQHNITCCPQLLCLSWYNSNQQFEHINMC